MSLVDKGRALRDAAKGLRKKASDLESEARGLRDKSRELDEEARLLAPGTKDVLSRIRMDERLIAVVAMQKEGWSYAKIGAVFGVRGNRIAMMIKIDAYRREEAQREASRTKEEQ